MALHLERCRLDGRWLAAVARFDVSGGWAEPRPGHPAALSTAAWLRYHCSLTPAAASALVADARRIAALPAVAAAVASGAISGRHAAVVAEATAMVADELARAADSAAQAAASDEPDPVEAAAVHTRVHAAGVSYARECADVVHDALLALAPDVDTWRLSRAARRARDAVHPDGHLERSERDHARRRLHLSTLLDGMVRLDGLLDPEGGAVVLAAIHALTHPGDVGQSRPAQAPEPASTLASGSDFTLAPGPASGARAAAVATVEDGVPRAGVPRAAVVAPPDPRTPSQARADALVDVCRRVLDLGDLPRAGEEKPHVSLIVSMRDLQQSESGSGHHPGRPHTSNTAAQPSPPRWSDPAGSAEQPTGGDAELGPARWCGPGGEPEPSGGRELTGGAELGGGGAVPVHVPMATARRLTCDSVLTRILTDARGLPLDVGRARRTAPASHRKALAIRDRHCVHSGCDRPPVWCDVHHIVHWADGGMTNLDNEVLLCRTHHRCVHTGHCDVTKTRDGRYTTRHVPANRADRAPPHRAPPCG